MPFHSHVQDRMLVTTLTGRVTDQELRAYYTPKLLSDVPKPWTELVDGTDVHDYAITPQGYADLAHLFATRVTDLVGGRVAMVATNELVYGMFRMWELRRESLNYEVRVFHDVASAQAWLQASAARE